MLRGRRVARIQSSGDARRMARGRLPWMVFDYIDGTEGEADRSRAAFDAIPLRSRILRDVCRRSLSVPAWGKPAPAPFGIAPMGMCSLSGPGADVMLARLAAREAVPLGVSTVASTPLEIMIDVAEGHA